MMRVFGYAVLPDGELAAMRREQQLQQELAMTAQVRAASAEAMMRLQARTIERLMESNDRMSKLVGDMRRSGFGILEPIETSDTPATVADYDREAVEADPDLAADDA